MPGIDTDVAGLLRSLVDFLECLGELELPQAQQSTRESLLLRSRAVLERNFDLTDSYLDMTAGKSLLRLASNDETDQSHDYVSMEDRKSQRVSLQHYYETFQGPAGMGTREAKESMDELKQLYSSFSASQAKSKAAKSGSLLHLKQERKIFPAFNVSWLNRTCWMSLVGSHLLLYSSDRESRPYRVLSLAQYKCRPAPGAIPHEPRRRDLAFELYCLGEPTYQFAADNAQDMREWVDLLALAQPPEPKRSGDPTLGEILNLEYTERKCIEHVKEEREKYQDVICLFMSKSKEKQANGKTAPTPETEKAEEAKEDSPPLSARTRRLPSLPSREHTDASETTEELYEEEGIYHQIKDVKAQREYLSCQMLDEHSSKPKHNGVNVDLVQDTYDDTEVFSDQSTGQPDDQMETYSDVQSVVSSSNEPIAYDDVQAMTDNARGKDKPKSAKSSKSNRKRSFLERMRIRNEPQQKEEDNNAEPELPCYDEVSSTARSLPANEQEYLSPPPPRPIYAKPPTIVKCAVPEEIYDDIGSDVSTGCRGCANVDVIKDHPKNNAFLSDLQMSIDPDHYQVPPPGHRPVLEPLDEIYDDVSLARSFKNSQRDSVLTTEKSMWSRLAKMRILNHRSRQNSCSKINEDDVEQQGKTKSPQKLVKKENARVKATKTNSLS